MAPNLPPILTSKTAKQILEGNNLISLDLGLSEKKIKWKNNRIYFPEGESIEKLELEKIREKENSAFFIKEKQVYMVAVAGKHFYKLLPTSGAPTIEINGIRMHRTKDTTPDQDAREKIKLLKIRNGLVLDTCTGLGYTSIEASKTGANGIVSVELKPSVHRVALMNPWSQDLYADKKINCMLGDSYQIMDVFPKQIFSTIIHDPPRNSLAGQLYSYMFYLKLYRILRPGGVLFHYTGKPRSKYRGVNIQKGIVERLRKAGFVEISYHENVLGLTAFKL
jgi:predicted methyltransferase